MKDNSNSPRRRRWHRSRTDRNGPIHVSQGIAATLAGFYHTLAVGTYQQRQAAAEFRHMVINMGKEAA
jgi:hypothetical protein